MTALTNPIPAEIRDFILKGEGNKSTGMHNKENLTKH